MEYSKVSNTDLCISRIALGCRSFAGGLYWGTQDEDDSIGTVLTALDLGINSFDTSPSYGNGISEEILGKALVDRRDQALIVSSLDTRVADADSLVKSCESSLWRLRTDRIDLLQIDPNSMVMAKEELLKGLSMLLERGMIREFGLLNCDGKLLSEFRDASFVEVPYSLLNQGIGFEDLEECRRRELTVFAYGALHHGLLSGAYQKWDNLPVNRRPLVGIARSDKKVLSNNLGSE